MILSDQSNHTSPSRVTRPGSHNPGRRPAGCSRYNNRFQVGPVNWGHIDVRTQFRPFSGSGGHLGSFWAISTPKPIFDPGGQLGSIGVISTSEPNFDHFRPLVDFEQVSHPSRHFLVDSLIQNFLVPNSLIQSWPCSLVP